MHMRFTLHTLHTYVYTVVLTYVCHKYALSVKLVQSGL